MQRNELIINGGLVKAKQDASFHPGNYIEKDEEKCQWQQTKLQSDSSFTTTTSATEEEEEERPSKAQRCCGLLWLSLGLAACVSGSYVMWGTDLFTLFVHQNLVISKNSLRYEAWKSPPVHAFLRVYIFNFTNVQEFEQGREPKLRVEELGPYTYIEKLERVDVRFNKNGTATYRDKKTYKFSPEHSRGNESDITIVPNLPFLAAMSLTAEMSAILRWSIGRFLKSMGEPFISLKVGEFLWGYEDRFSVLAQNLLSIRYDLPFKKFGILAAKNQTQKDLVTIYTGEEDPSMTGIVVSYDGKTSLNYWNSEECNRIDGTDGTIYPPALIHPNSTLYIYLKDLCRKIPLVYSRQYLDKHGIPVLRFHMPRTAFASGEVHKDNMCFCSLGNYGPKCLPSGVFNVGPCTYEAPIVTSLPHFLYGDPILSESVEGLQPEVKKHETFVEVDPKMGIPLGGKSRLQLNVLVKGGLKFNKYYKNQFLFPIIWMEYGVDRMPDDLSAMIRSLLSFIKVVEIGLSYGFIFFGLLLALFFVTGCRQALRRVHQEEEGKETPLVVIHEKR